MAGLEILSVREVANQFAERFGNTARFINSENELALLNNGQHGAELLGAPEVSAAQMIDWTTQWLRHGGELLDKPTHFEVVDGRY
jgi:hypothetical protein